jgi:DNA modification methylase
MHPISSNSAADYLNKIIVHDCRHMVQLPDNSIDLMITSPPYNATKEYDDNLTLREYLDFLKAVLTEVNRVLKPNGIIAFNIANVGRKPYIPLDCYVIEILQGLGLVIFDEIIWNKAASAGGSCAWGSWMSAANPTLRDVHEYIILAIKPPVPTDSICCLKFPLEDIKEHEVKYDMRSFTIKPRELKGNVWQMSTESATRVNHPAPFPVELPYRLILLFTKKGDTVLDPFMGSGSVAIACVLSGRNYVGYDISEEYVQNAKNRIENAIAKNHVKPLESFLKKGGK